MKFNSNYVITNLKEHPELYNELISLLHENFNYSQKNFYNIDFAPLFEKENHKNIHLLIERESSQLIGHVGFQKRLINFYNFNLPICLIGGVSIKKEFQNKGLFSIFFQNLLNYYKNDNSLFILWSDKIKLFEKFNFYPQGCQKVYDGCDQHLIHNENIFTKSLYRNLSKEEQEQIKILYREGTKNQISLIRTENDWNNIEKISSSDLYYLKKSKDSKIIAYFFKNKGQDLNNIVHEAFFEQENIFAKENLIKILSCEQIWLNKISEYFDNSKMTSTFLALIYLANENFISDILKQFGVDILKRDENFIFIQQSSTTKKFKIQRFIDELFFNNFLKIENYCPLQFISGLDSI